MSRLAFLLRFFMRNVKYVWVKTSVCRLSFLLRCPTVEHFFRKIPRLFLLLRMLGYFGRTAMAKDILKVVIGLDKFNGF